MRANELTFGVLHLFAGIGGAALGMQEATTEYRGVNGNFVTLAGIDCDLEACDDFEKLTGAPAVNMDLFSREDYTAFHGEEPPQGWREAVPGDIREATQGIYPDAIFLSPPCKGFSGLLPTKSAKSDKYQALNRLTVRGLWLSLEAFRDNPPGIILLENVPRITTRGAELLRQIKALLAGYGYVFHEGSHDCGEIGGLGQHRRRYLLIARLPDKIPNFVYKPPELRVKSIGEIVGPLPLPDNQNAGPMHRMPRLQWKTWVRLALIPAGGDWRDLEKIAPEQYCLQHIPRKSTLGVSPWDKPGPTVIGHARVGGSQASAISDPRLSERDNRHPGVYRVVRFNEPGPCVTGTRFGSGAPAIADPRLGCKCRNGLYGVLDWDKPSCTVTGARNLHSGTAAVADPRVPKDTEQGVWIIIAEDGAWHRPLTTLELAALQGFPTVMDDGSPLVLTGKSDARWRERIGNAVPPPAAKAIGEQVLRTLLLSACDGWELSATPIWVVPELPAEAVKQ